MGGPDAAEVARIFANGVRWFHSGGIFAALSETTGELIIEAMKAAKASGAVTDQKANIEVLEAWRQGTVEERLSHALVKGIDTYIDADTEEARQAHAILKETAGLPIDYRGFIEGDSIPDIFIPRMIELHGQGRFPFDRLIGYYDLEDINRAAEDAEGGGVADQEGAFAGEPLGEPAPHHGFLLSPSGQAVRFIGKRITRICPLNWPSMRASSVSASGDA